MPNPMASRLMQVFLSVVLFTTGTVSQYAPGVMERVIQVRQHRRTSYHLPHELPVTDGYIAVLDCDAIGQTWYLRPTGRNCWESFLVVDCAGSTATRCWMQRNHILAEVDYGTILQWGGTPRRGIKGDLFQYHWRVEDIPHPRGNVPRPSRICVNLPDKKTEPLSRPTGEFE